MIREYVRSTIQNYREGMIRVKTVASYIVINAAVKNFWEVCQKRIEKKRHNMMMLKAI